MNALSGKIRFASTGTFLLFCSFVVPDRAGAQEPVCSPAATSAFSMPGLSVTGAKWQEPDKGLPRHCLLTAKLNERKGSDGITYAIAFEMRLPTEWNGRFLHQVNGGNDGVVVPALGDRADGWSSGGKVALARGFAVLSSDSGHSGSDPAHAALGLARGASFGLDAQARRDYGYVANIALAQVAKALLYAHFGKPPEFSYMAGCSNGGRHAMVAASRMPHQYDGFLAGNPGFNLPRAAIQHAWDIQHFAKADSDVRKSITRDDGALISQRIIEACDGLDGAKDGLVSNLAACQKAFDIRSLQCRPGGPNACLGEAKTRALAASFAGPKNTRGEALYADWPFDGGVGMGNWRAWKVESTVVPWNNFPIISTMGAASLGYIFTTPPTKLDGTIDSLAASLLAFDFDRDAPKIFAKDANYPESAMEFMTPPDVDDPKLEAFRAQGRKILVYHGQADPVFSFNDTANWYEKLNRNTGGKAPDFARLFAMPGVTHCGGGVGLDMFDALSALTDWVEKGVVPERIIAMVNPANKDVPTEWSKARTRPLCPWPSYAHHQIGDVENAASFVCASP
jgi:Tannase and feruloyl esterase